MLLESSQDKSPILGMNIKSPKASKMTFSLKPSPWYMGFMGEFKSSITSSKKMKNKSFLCSKVIVMSSKASILSSSLPSL